MKSCILLLLITIAVFCAPVEGCMRGGIPPVGAGAIIAICVVFSPVIIVGGAGYVALQTGKKVKQSVEKRMTTSNVIRKQRNRMIKKIGAKNFDNYLQDLFNKTKTETSPDLFVEFGTALFLNNDILNAYDWLTKALDAFKANPTVEFKKHGAAYFMRGMVNQYLLDFAHAVEDFKEAQKHLDGTRFIKTADGGAELPQLTVYDAINATGFAKMLQVLYPDPTHLYTIEDYEAEVLTTLTDAIKDITTAIDTTPDPQGMYFHNRGFARYHRSYRLPDDQKEAEIELAIADFNQAIGSGNFGTTAEGHSMKSQCLARLGKLEEAKAEQAKAFELDSKVFLVQLESPDEYTLKVPWPLPVDKYKNTNNNHNFREVDFKIPRYCTHCNSLIKAGKAQECYHCGFRCHNHCHAKVKGKDCWGLMKNEATYAALCEGTQGESLPVPKSHVHHLRAVHFRKPTWCDLCLKFVASPVGKQGFQCKDCNVKIHKDCIDLIGTHVVEEN